MSDEKKPLTEKIEKETKWMADSASVKAKEAVQQKEKEAIQQKEKEAKTALIQALVRINGGLEGLNASGKVHRQLALDVNLIHSFIEAIYQHSN